MKKVLAVVLTLAMLLSCVVVGLSAALVSTKEEQTNHYWSFTGGNAYNPISLGSTPSSNFALSFDLKFEESQQANHGILSYGNMGVPYIDFNAKTIGVDSGTLTYEAGWTEGVWYNFVFDSTDGGNAKIYCNGQEIGTASSPVSAASGFFGNWRDVGLDNIKTYNGDTVYFTQNFENGAIEGQGSLYDETSATYTYENVYSYETADKYWQYDANNAYIYASLIDDASNGYQLTLDFKLDDTDENKSEFRSYFGTDIVISNTKIGVGSSTQACNLKSGVWYKALFNSIAGSGTGIVVWDSNNEVVVQTASSNNLGKDWCGGGILVSIDNIIVADAAGTAIWTENFNDGTFDKKYGDGNGIISAKTAEERVALGNYYALANTNGAYTELPDPNSNGASVSFDYYQVDSATKINGAIVAGNATYYAPTISATAVGIGEKTVAYNFKNNTWYTIDLDSTSAAAKAAGGTIVYVDGVKIGTVDAKIGSTPLMTAYGIGVDNFKMYYHNEDGSKNVYFNENFEDGSVDFKNEASYTITAFEPAPEKALIDYVPVTAAEGSAMLINSNGEYATFFTGDFTATQNRAISFNLALIPNATSDASKPVYFETWSNVATRRWIVGSTFTGRDEDRTQFDWGETTVENFHQVTYIFKNGRGYIYVDGTQVYEGAQGELFANMQIFAVWNGSAIIDNLAIYDTADLSGDTFPVIKAHTDANDFTSNGEGAKCDYRNVELKATAEFCGASGHIYGPTEITKTATCFAEGELTTKCAICGAVMMTEPIAMTAHSWTSYDKNRLDDNGLTYVYCHNDGCTEKRYSTVPAADSYTGSYYQYSDFQDDMYNVLDKGLSSKTWEYTDGKLAFTEAKGNSQNYNSIQPLVTVPTNNWSMSFDVVYNGSFDTNDTTSYGHRFNFWFGGSNGISLEAGYDADAKALFLRNEKSYGATGIDNFSIPFEMVVGESYNFQIRYDTARVDEYYAGVYFLVNGAVVASWVDNGDAFDASASYDLPYSNSELGEVIIRNFGIAMDIDNLVIGDKDFAWNRTYAGDLDGDYTITTNDALLMRKTLAKIDVDALTSRMDANGDGAINALDQLTIRKALLAG